VSVAFAGPLLALLGLPGCGFHLYGAPGKGKSTLLSAAASVMGDRSFRGSWNITKNALEGYGAARNDNVLILDEIGETQAATLTEALYMLGNGQGKGRAGSRGEATPRVSFRVAILSSGELAASSHGASAGKRLPDGTAIRLIDLRADGQRHGAFDELHGATSPAEFARQIDRATQEVFGTAGLHLIEKLIRNRAKKDTFRAAHRSYMVKMRNSLATVHDGQVERAIERFAAVALAGELASKMGLTGWKPGEAKAAAMLLLQSWFSDRVNVEGLSAAEVLSSTKDWLRANAANATTQADYVNGTIAGPFTAAKDKSWIYISGELWASIHGAEDATAAARVMVKLGVMDHGDGKNLQHKSPRWIPGRPRVFKLRLAPFEEALGAKPE
jgi:putative DNA primase/helicase